MIPVIRVKGAPFRARVYVYPHPEHSKRRWRVEVQLAVRHWDTGKRGYLTFHTEVDLPRDGRPRRDTVIRLARYNLHRALVHEADECLVVDGERPFDPHARKRRRK